MARRTYEEHVGETLDELYDGALLLTGDERRAEALVVDVVVRGAEAFRSRRPDEFRPWILTRMCRQFLEFARERGGLDAEPPAGDAIRTGALEALAGQLDDDPGAFRPLVREALASLPVDSRAAMWLVAIVGVPYRGAAAALGLDRNGLRQLLWRARCETYARLARSAGEPGRRGGEGRA